MDEISKGRGKSLPLVPDGVQRYAERLISFIAKKNVSSKENPSGFSRPLLFGKERN